MKEIRESVDLEEVPKIDDPIETSALSNGWFSMSDGAVIAVYGTGTQVILYKYFVDKSKKR